MAGGSAGRPRELRKRRIARDLETDGLTVSRDELRASFARSALKRMTPITLDRSYRIPTRAILDRMIRRSTLDERKYTSERFDCDDFALLFKAEAARHWQLNSIGMVADYSGRHAYTAACIRDPDADADADADAETPAGDRLSWLLIEPQNDRIIQAGESLSESEVYRLERGWVLL